MFVWHHMPFYDPTNLTKLTLLFFFFSNINKLEAVLLKMYCSYALYYAKL